jgi:hypothetical protein
MPIRAAAEVKAQKAVSAASAIRAGLTQLLAGAALGERYQPRHSVPGDHLDGGDRSGDVPAGGR